mgnify:CR=1 FL=1
MEDFIVSKHGKGKNAKYYKIINKPGGITEISRSTYYRLSKILEKQTQKTIQWGNIEEELY